MMLLVAAVLAIVLTGLFIGVCLLIALAQNAIGGHSRRDRYGAGGPPDFPPAVPAGRHRGASRPPVTSWRVDR